MEKIMEFFYSAKPEDVTDAHSFVKSSVPYIEVALSDDEDLLLPPIRIKIPEKRFFLLS